MHKRFLRDAEARALYCSVRQIASDEGYEELLADANRHLKYLHFELRRIKYLLDGVWYVALVNTKADEVAKAHGTPYTFQQLHMLRQILEEIALDPEAEGGKGSIGSTAALNLEFTQTQATQASQGTQTQGPKTKLTMAEKSRLLECFCLEGWLVASPPGQYSIGPRSFLELHEFLLSVDLPDATREAWERFM